MFSEDTNTNVLDGSFSHDSFCNETERLELENRYKDIIVDTDLFSRKTVSFQANKVEKLHSWMKYREGFSAELVNNLFDLIDINENDWVIDPFAGSATTLLEAQFEGVNSLGIELLPNCHLAWEAKSSLYEYNIGELTTLLDELKTIEAPSSDEINFKHIRITQGAFSEKTQSEIEGYLEWIKNSKYSDDAKNLFSLVLMDCLEDLSYTRKDGQYLRWDGRSPKIIKRNKKRKAKGKKPIKGIYKGPLPNTKELIVTKFENVVNDIKGIIRDKDNKNVHRELIKGNTLYELPKLEDNKFDGLITSPPYLNRYDYTRTYALELAFLEVYKDIFNLRQELLSATVESKSKRKQLEDFYNKINRQKDFEKIIGIVDSNSALKEVNQCLLKRAKNDEVNNKNILRMVAQYFEELTFVFYEIRRIMKPGSKVVFVNDNVRYAGEVIPVDTLSTNLAEQVGLKPKNILVIPQKKGNSSQQMKRYGKRALRKSLTIWQK